MSDTTTTLSGSKIETETVVPAASGKKAPKGYSVSTLPGFSIIAIFTFFALYAPIMILVLYSFNAGTSLAIWEGFSLRWYAQAAGNERVIDAAIRSLILAGSAATIASISATMAALATTRTRRFKGRTMIYALENRDLPVIQGVTLLLALIYAMSNLLADVVIAILDPRVRFA